MEGEKKQFEELLKLMPDGWKAKAKELGALRRSRKIKTPEELLRLIFLYLTDGKSFGGTSALLQVLDNVKMDKKAVWKRIGNSAGWLRWMCVNFCREQGILFDKPAWLPGKRVCLADGSNEVLSGGFKTCFRLHYGLDLFSLGMTEMLLTDIKTGEKLSNFKEFGVNDIVVADRVYVAALRLPEGMDLRRVAPRRLGIRDCSGNGAPAQVWQRFYLAAKSERVRPLQ